MSNINPIGVDLSTGQIKPLAAGDSLKVSSGNLTVASGDAATTTAVGGNLLLRSGAGGSVSGKGGDLDLGSGPPSAAGANSGDAYIYSDNTTSGTTGTNDHWQRVNDLAVWYLIAH
jgi:hypothetical protein